MPAPFFEYRFSEDWVSENPATYLALLKGNRMFMRWKWAVLKADPRSGFWKIPHRSNRFHYLRRYMGRSIRNPDVEHTRAIPMNHDMRSKRQERSWDRAVRLFYVSIGLLYLDGCTSTTTTVSRGQTKQPRGFMEKMVDQITERECNVGRFICPYGLGPAGEPCDCTDPSGYVLKGLTVK